MHLNPLLCSQMMMANFDAALQRHESVYKTRERPTSPTAKRKAKINIRSTNHKSTALHLRFTMKS